MKRNSRTFKINQEILKETAKIIREEIKDPRIGIMTSVIDVDTTNDLKYCKIFITTMGTKEEKKETVEILNRSKGYVRKQIASRINLRQTPEITFYLDETLEKSMRINDLLGKI